MANNVIGIQPNEIIEMEDNLDDMVGDVFFRGDMECPLFFMLAKVWPHEYYMLNIHNGGLTPITNLEDVKHFYTRTNYVQMELS